jgi:uncharacterized protein (TIGR02270 family)
MQDATDIVEPVLREHVEMAAFQWAQRDTLLQEDPPDLDAVATVDARLEANLDGIRIAGKAAWPFIIDAFETYPEKGELFVTAFHAIETEDAKRIEQAVCFARVAEEGPRGLCGAFEWLPPAATRDHVRNWIHSTDPIRCEAAIAACAAHGADPGELLPRLLAHPGAGPRAASCSLAATFGRQDAVSALRKALGDPEGAVRDSAAAALARLGHRDGEALLKQRVLAMEEGWPKLLRTLIAATPDADMRDWLTGLNAAPETKVIAVRGAGMLGDRSLLAWLIRLMRDPALAQAAAQSFRELFPEAREVWDDLTSLDPADHGGAFKEHFGDGMELLPVANRLKDWANSQGLTATVTR